MSAAIDSFLAMLAAERGAARNTLDAYARDLRGSEELIGDLLAATRDDLGQLAGKWSALAPATVARKVSALRQFYAFAADEGWRADDPSAALPRPQARRPLPRLLSHREVAALFRRAEEVHEIHGGPVIRVGQS